MRKYVIISGIAAAVLLLIGFFVYKNFEIYPRKVPVGPARSVTVNNYYALEKWLAKTGHPVRVEKQGTPGSIVSGTKKAVVIQSSVFDWKNAAEILTPWIEAGGFLVVSVDDYFDDDEGPAAFLETLGLRYENYNGPDDESAAPLSEDLSPDFDRNIYFTYTGAVPAVIMEDPAGIIRLVKITAGKGAVTVIGSPVFMYNDYLEERELNARLSWDLTGAAAGDEDPGVLFIHGKRTVKSLFGKLAERGNILPPGLSVLILIVAGFWMVLPSFGLLFREREQSLRPIRERFLAETHFLKKYRALETYLEIYLREIKAKGQGRKPEGELAAIENVLKKGKGLRYNDLVRSLKICQTIMERL
ncbi:MAG: hypothetical protein LBN21_11950 [Treponema sp.]|jgi:hypothetical protein|nr:hypothetical protein [Treponema sp.]